MKNALILILVTILIVSATNSYMPSAADTYTPALTNTTNITSSTGYDCTYTRIGNIVTVYGHVDITPTIGGIVELGFSLPIASNFTAANDANGTFGNASDVTDLEKRIFADATNDRVTIFYESGGATPTSPYFTFQYQIK